MVELRESDRIEPVKRRRRIVQRKGYYRIEEGLYEAGVWLWHFYIEDGRAYQTSMLRAARRKVQELKKLDDLEYGEWKVVSDDEPD
jgi:hypothetical protein